MSLPKKINRKSRKITKTFNIADRLDTMAKQECFITLKVTKKTIPKIPFTEPYKKSTW